MDVGEDDSISEKPVAVEFISQFAEGNFLFLGQRTDAGVESGVGMVAHVVELGEIGFASAGAVLGKSVFAEEIARFVKAETDVSEGAFAIQIVVAHLPAAGFDVVEAAKIDGESTHQNQQGAETKDHGGARADALARIGMGSGGVGVGSGVSVRHGVSSPGGVEGATKQKIAYSEERSEDIFYRR
jgi:hypothetical protein